MALFFKILFYVFVFVSLLIIMAWLALQYFLSDIADALDPEKDYTNQHKIHWQVWEGYLGELELAGLSPREVSSDRLIPCEDGSGFQAVGYGTDKPLRFKPPKPERQTEKMRKTLAFRQSVARSVKERVSKIANGQYPIAGVPKPINKSKAKQAINAFYRAMGQKPPKKIDFYSSGYDLTILSDEKRHGKNNFDWGIGGVKSAYMNEIATTPLNSKKALWGRHDWKRNGHLFPPDFAWLARYKHADWESQSRIKQFMADHLKTDHTEMILKGDVVGEIDDLNALTMFWYTDAIGVNGDGTGRNFSTKERVFMGLLGDLIREAGYVILYQNFALVMGRPADIQFDKHGKLHHSARPALIWDKQRPQYFVHGEEVPAKLILRPKSLKLTDLLLKQGVSWESHKLILSHIKPESIAMPDILGLGTRPEHWTGNREPEHFQLTRVREALIQHIGIARFIKISKAKQRDKTPKGTLWRYDFVTPKIFEKYHMGAHVWHVLAQWDPKTKKIKYVKIPEHIATVQTALDYLASPDEE